MLLTVLCTSSASAQSRLTEDAGLEKQLYETGLIHSPLLLDTVRSLEAGGRKKKVVIERPLTVGEGTSRWHHSGKGGISLSTQKTLSGRGSIRLAFPTCTGERAVGSPSDPDYATYGNAGVSYQVGGENWEKYNRISFFIYPDCEGARIVNMNLTFNNDNSTPKAGYNSPSGSHLINLENKAWNHCTLEIDEYQRDKVICISFDTALKGRDRTTGDSAIYYLDDFRLQQIKEPEKVSGWTPSEHVIAYSTTGYEAGSPKTAIVNADLCKTWKNFQLLDTVNGQVVYEGALKQERTTLGEFGVMNFTDFDRSGNYRLRLGDRLTPPFRIGEKLWDNSTWRVLNFLFCQRCGYLVPGKHATCHTDLFSEHNGLRIPYSGGWHDAGDLSQQTLQTGDVAFALLEAYNKQKTTNPALAARLLEEAEWGIEFILKNRYGDGYRASSMGLLIWQDGIQNSLDDIHTVRVQNLAFDNFLYAGYEAYAALTIDRDPMLQEHLRRVAEEDFAFATEKFGRDGFDTFKQMYEHSYNTSHSQYMATISWSASMLYRLTGEPRYAETAAEAIRYTLECQCAEPLKDKDGTCGFFYRDKSRRSIVHYIHQSREQVYMQALALLCETQPEHPDRPKWAKAIRLYGDYLKGLMRYTAPYGMLPGGVYHKDEYQDSTAFYSLHLFPPADARERYTEQLMRGVKLDEEHYIKRFPVWFSIFNGNTAVHLSTGKAAAICGHFLHDEELLRIAREQLYWTVGKNPFGQSLIYGEGYRYPQMNSFSSGEMTGEMPVGIRTLGDDDIPYWPQTNNACYKEVWVTSAGKWLSLISEL